MKVMESLCQLSAIFGIVVIFINTILAIEEYTDYAALVRNDLLEEGQYDQLSSPHTVNKEVVTTVMLSLVIKHIYKLEESTGTLITNGWLLATWEDFRLKWASQNYGGISRVHFPGKSIWLPDLMLYNEVEAMSMDSIRDALILVFDTGLAAWVAPVTLKSTCLISLKYYPFDEHQCNMTIGPWSYTSSEVVLDLHYVDPTHQDEMLAKFPADNPEWELLDQSVKIVNETYSCCPQEQFQKFTVQVWLRRRTPFYKYILIMPSVVAMLLTISTFWLSPDDKSKFAIGGIALITYVILLIFLGMKIPPGGTSIPAIVLFCGNSLLMSALSILIAVLNVRISHSTNTSQVPDQLKALINGPVGKIFCIEPTNPKVRPNFASITKAKAEEMGEAPLVDCTQVEIENLETCNTNAAAETPSGQDWNAVATAIDRICFIVYCIVFAIILVSSFT